MIDLTDYGYIEKNNIQTENLIPARVIEVHRNFHKIICEHGEMTASLKGSLLNQATESQDFPAVGDFVLIQYNSSQAVIHEILPRTSKFSRPDYSGHGAGYVKTILEQVVAANFDYVFIMCSLNLDFNVGRIQRYLAAAWQSGGIPVIILTKTDLCEDYEEQLWQVQKASATVDVVAVSAKTGDGLNLLAPYLGKGKTIVFLGSSGVGKSSLVNALAEEEIMKVNEIREDDSKGRHTTTYRQLIKLPDGTLVIDTPGMREISLWDANDGLSELFSDIENLFMQCKFKNCHHDTEPGCAIKAALASGELSEERWQSYCNLKKEAKFTEDKAAYLRTKEKWHKEVSKWSKNNKRSKKKGGAEV